MNIFITGIAGMIGMHTAKKLASEGHHVIGIDNYNNYYDVILKIDSLFQVLNDFANKNKWKIIEREIINVGYTVLGK